MPAPTTSPRRLTAAALVALLGVAGVLAGSQPAAAAGPPPGTVLTAKNAPLPPELAPLAKGQRIEYVSTSVTGAAITVTGLVLTPKKSANNRIVAWGHGTTGLADQCAPSNHKDVFWPEARAAVGELLRRGWTVAAPDYPGLGTPAPHPYLIGASEARALIDNVKAARNLNPALGDKYAVDGHSQGGQAALFSTELAPSYDGPLVLTGVAAIAPVSNVGLLAPNIPGTAEQGYLVMALYGLAAVDASVHPQTLLSPAALQKAPVLQSGCLFEILDAYAGFAGTSLLAGGALPDAVVAKLAANDDPAQSPSSSPILIVQGTADEAVPAFVTDILVGQLGGQPPLTYVSIPGATHDGAVFASVTTVADWIAARFGS